MRVPKHKCYLFFLTLGFNCSQLSIKFLFIFHFFRYFPSGLHFSASEIKKKTGFSEKRTLLASFSVFSNLFILGRFFMDCN